MTGWAFVKPQRIHEADQRSWLFVGARHVAPFLAARVSERQLSRYLRTASGRNPVWSLRLELRDVREVIDRSACCWEGARVPPGILQEPFRINQLDFWYPMNLTLTRALPELRSRFLNRLSSRERAMSLETLLPPQTMLLFARLPPAPTKDLGGMSGRVERTSQNQIHITTRPTRDDRDYSQVQ